MNKPLLLCCVFIFLMINANAQKIKTDTTIKKTNDTTKVSDTSAYVPLKYRNIHKRSPVLACFLSLYITGLGQVYNKQVLKGGVLFGVTVISFGAAEVYHANHVLHPDDGITVALLVPFFAAYVYSAIDAPVTASYLNRTYHLGKKKKGFTSLHISPSLINAGIGNKFDAGLSLILR
jgi:hypothetical protein